jgi:hypothetical protein
MNKSAKYIVIVLWAAISFAFFSVSQSAAEQVPYPTGYRSWIHVKSGIVGKDSLKFKKYEGIHHIYANPKAMEGFEKGIFPDGSVIVFDLLETQEDSGITSEGPRRFIDVMHKDSKKYAKTADWGFEEFNGSTTTRLLTEENAISCSACHASQKDHVFSNFRK